MIAAHTWKSNKLKHKYLFYGLCVSVTIWTIILLLLLIKPNTFFIPYMEGGTVNYYSTVLAVTVLPIFGYALGLIQDLLKTEKRRLHRIFHYGEMGAVLMIVGIFISSLLTRFATGNPTPLLNGNVGLKYIIYAIAGYITGVLLGFLVKPK